MQCSDSQAQSSPERFANRACAKMCGGRCRTSNKAASIKRWGRRGRIVETEGSVMSAERERLMLDMPWKVCLRQQKRSKLDRAPV